MTMQLHDGFAESVQTSYALVASIYQTSDNFAATLHEAFPNLPAFSAFLDTLKALPGAVFLLARDETGAGGYVFLKPRAWQRLSHTADLTMGVSVAAQGRGMGRFLLEAAIAQARRQRRLEILYLMVRADNAGALRLYERAGFTQQARLADDTKIGDMYFDGILMSKSLRRPSGQNTGLSADR